MNIRQWAKEQRERRKAGESFRPAGSSEQPDPAVRTVEIAAPMIGDAVILIDGQPFKGILDFAVEGGLEAPTIVTLRFYANVVTRKPAPPPSKDD